MNKRRALLMAAVFPLAVDQLCKWVVLTWPHLFSAWRWPWFVIEVHPNTGIAFSLPLTGVLQYLLIIALIVLVAIWIRQLVFQNKWQEALPLALILSGAVSNIIDRVRVGHVVDMLTIPGVTSLNIADIAITIGVAWALLQLVKQPRHL